MNCSSDISNSGLRFAWYILETGYRPTLGQTPIYTNPKDIPISRGLLVVSGETTFPLTTKLSEFNLVKERRKSLLSHLKSLKTSSQCNSLFRKLCDDSVIFKRNKQIEKDQPSSKWRPQVLKILFFTKRKWGCLEIFSWKENCKIIY